MRACSDIKINTLVISLFSFICFACCKSNKKQTGKLPDTSGSGSINISADESFKPVVDELTKVYESNHSGTKINVLYKPEAECFKDFFVDSISLIIGTRMCQPDERDLMIDSFSVYPVSTVVARDAVAVIVNPAVPESNFSMADIKAILTGKFKKKLIPVFDGVKATSTVRFIIDSVLRGDSLTQDAVAARSSTGVIDYIAKTPGAIGFIGISWIGNHEDPEQLSYLKEVKMAGIESAYFPGKYVKAYQQDIYNKNYPLVRDLVYILKEKNYKGLAYGFADFLKGEIGQLIFRRAYLVPQAIKNFGIRKTTLKE
jgi:phosphate transport system substrate-binding protein